MIRDLEVFNLRYRFLALTCAAFLLSSFVSFVSLASQRNLNANLEAQATIEIVEADVEKSSEELDKIISKSDGKILRKRKMIENEGNVRRVYYYQVRFKSSKVEAALSQIRRIGTVDRETASYDMAEETVDVSIEISDKRERRGPVRAAQLFAGATAAAVNLSLSNEFNRSMLGAGVSLTPRGKWAYLSILVLKDNTKNSMSNQQGSEVQSASGSSMLVIGHNYYSSILGNGENTFFNPFAGVNYGIARLYNRTMLAFGGTLGVELLNTEWVTISAAAKVNGLYSAKDGGTSTMYVAQMALPF
jgi:hypothetical protein